VTMLVAAGAAPDHRDLLGSTPLMLAVVADDKSYVRVLLSAGASENLINTQQESALTFAIGLSCTFSGRAAEQNAA